MGLLGSRLGGAPFSALRSRVNKTRALIVLAAIGFGCWHGARDLASGMSPYSGDAHVWAFLVFEGATFLLAAALSYGGFLLSAKPLLACGLGVGAVYCLSSSGFLGEWAELRWVLSAKLREARSRHCSCWCGLKF